MGNYIRLNRLLKMIPVSGSTIHDWVKKGVFPPPIQLNPGVVGSPIAWPEDVVLAWLESRPKGYGIGAVEARAARWNKKRLPYKPVGFRRGDGRAPPPRGTT